MKLEFPSAQVFSSSVDAIAALIDEAEFIVKPDGLYLKATDPSNISMVDFRMPKKAFSVFDVKEPVKLGLDLDQLSQVSKRSKASDKVALTLDDGQNQLIVEFKGKSTRQFNIPLIDLSKPELPDLKIDFDAEIQISCDMLTDALKDAQLISNHIVIACGPKFFAVRAKSSRGTVNNETARVDLVSADIKDECQSMFPLDYLADMLKAASSKDVISIRMKDHSPLGLSYAIGDAQISYFLAPRIEPK